MKIKLLSTFLIFLLFACQSNTKENKSKVHEKIENATPKGTANVQKIEIKIEGMTCTGCENAIEKTIDEFEGVYSSKANHKKGIAVLEFDSTKVDITKVEEAINELGYEAKGHSRLIE